jgi:hypothetical protein
MSFKNKFRMIIIVIFALGTVIQLTRLNIHMKTQTNEEFNESLKVQGEQISQELLSNVTSEKILVVSSDVEAEDITANLVKTLDYMKKDYDSIKASQFAELDINKYENIILLIGDIDSIGNTEKLFNFVAADKNIFFANGLYEGVGIQNISKKLGINKIGTYVEAEGIKLLENVLMKSKGIEIKDNIIVSNSSLNVELTNEVKTYATDSYDLPLLWSNKYGDGNIFYFNGTMLREKENRGFISGVLSLMNTDDIYPIINAKVEYIDDYPSPIPDGEDENISKEYGLNIKRFYKEIWWSDMLKVSAQNNMIYTGVFNASYNNEVNDLSKTKIDLSEEDFEYYARELFSSGGELGLHGYNHQPLKTEEFKNKELGYSPWVNSETMTEGINKALDFVNDELNGNYIRSYVPPSNIITEEGITALQAASKDIKIIGSVYSTDPSSDGYSQELEIKDNGTINLPRMTSGYEFTDDVKWSILNSANLNGYVSHFVHPDDVLDSVRSANKSWKDLSSEFGNMNNFVFTNYEWLNATTASDAAKQLVSYQNTKVSYEKTKDYINIYCDNFTGPIYFIFRTTKEIGHAEDCDVNKIDGNTYLVKAKKSISKINLVG